MTGRGSLCAENHWMRNGSASQENYWDKSACRSFAAGPCLYAAFFCPAFTFDHRNFCAAAIFLRADADMVRFGFCVCFCFAQRARCAAAILLRPAAEIVRFVFPAAFGLLPDR